MAFEDALRNDIPLAEAAHYFLRLKTAAVDPPDETGELEGQFAAPVEQVLKLMTEMVENELKTMYAYKAYAASLRDFSHFAVAKEFEEHADNELEHADFLLRRMTVLGGPITLTDIPAPPATTDPNAIVETMVRMEQEGIEKWRALLAMLGDNPTRYKVEEFLARELEHLDELWQLRPYQGSAQPTSMMTREQAAPVDMMPANAAPAAAPAAPAEAPKIANAAMADMPSLPGTAKGQNPIQATPTQLPAAAMGQHKTALALKPLPAGQAEAIGKALSGVERGLQSKRLGILRQVAPDLKSLAERAKSVPKMKAASAFKLALEQIGYGSPGAPAAPPAAPQAAPTTPGSAPTIQDYLAREQDGAAGQEQNELGFYRQRMQEAFGQLQQQKQQSEQTAAEVQQLQQQVQTTQAQQEQYQAMVSDATQKAVSAQDDVLREQQASAAMRMAYQQLRGELLNVASREPPNTQMLQEQAALTSGPATPMAGPAGDASTPGTAPGSPAPQGQETASAPAAGADPAMQQAKPTSEAGQKEPGSGDGTPKTSSVLDGVTSRIPHALAGAALGGAAETAYAHKSSDPLRAKVDRLGAQPERSFGQAMDLAQAKARLALADAVSEHPKAALLSGMALGGLEGAMSGPGIVDHVRTGVKNLKSLSSLGG